MAVRDIHSVILLLLLLFCMEKLLLASRAPLKEDPECGLTGGGQVTSS